MTPTYSATNGHAQWRHWDLTHLAETYGTPLFIYDQTVIARQFETLRTHLGDSLDLFFAVKANPNLTLLGHMDELADGYDISSGGELQQILRAGIETTHLSFAGPGKTDQELELAIHSGVGFISCESVRELQRIDLLAQKLDKRANVGLRINPARKARGFGIMMGGKPSQFGVDEEVWPSYFEALAQTERCDFKGIHIYSGTQSLDPDALVDNFNDILRLATDIQQQSGHTIQWINFGGGFGLSYYEDQEPLDLADLGQRLRASMAQFRQQPGCAEVRGILEFGRFLVGEAGLYVTRAVDVKHSRGQRFCVLDGGMNHHLPASGNFGQVFRRNYRISNLSRPPAEKQESTTFVGPICTTIDVMGLKVPFSTLEEGDYIAVHTSGAYGLTCSPLFFLSHETPRELLLLEDQVLLIRESMEASILNTETAR
ncbi:type III PLP-dependent enzyme [Magnetococcus sp. PR-3]|uniref:type III PLP-dependent enzyme n=1 Tax=Magnetococcus sp. PR-3 TaxID=3120355 RepID=UPI002FCE632D